jgi:hypothetical protein
MIRRGRFEEYRHLADIERNCRLCKWNVYIRPQYFHWDELALVSQNVWRWKWGARIYVTKFSNRRLPREENRNVETTPTQQCFHTFTWLTCVKTRWKENKISFYHTLLPSIRGCYSVTLWIHDYVCTYRALSCPCTLLSFVTFFMPLLAGIGTFLIGSQ